MSTFTPTKPAWLTIIERIFGSPAPEPARRAAAPSPLAPDHHGLLDIAEAGAGPVLRIAAVALREMRADPALAGAIVQRAGKHIKAVRREHTAHILAQLKASRARLTDTPFHREAHIQLNLEAKQALDNLRRQCRRPIDFLHGQQLSLRR